MANVREKLQNHFDLCNQAVDMTALFINLDKLKYAALEAKQMNIELADEELNRLINQAKEVFVNVKVIGKKILATKKSKDDTLEKIIAMSLSTLLKLNDIPALLKLVNQIGAKEAHQLSVKFIYDVPLQNFLLLERAKAFIVKRGVKVGFENCLKANVTIEIKMALAKVLLIYYAGQLGVIQDDIKKTIMTLVDMLGEKESRKIISSSRQLNKLYPEVDRHFRNQNIVRMLHSFGRKIANCSDSKSSTRIEEFTSDLLDLCNDLAFMREVKSADSISNDIRALILEATRVISIRTLQIADNLKSITDKMKDPEYLEGEAKKHQARSIKPFLQADPIVHAANSSAHYQKSLSDIFDNLTKEKDNRIQIIKTSIRALMETDQSLAINIIHQVIDRAGVENSYDICISYPESNQKGIVTDKNDYTAKLVYADTLLFSSETPDRPKYYHDLLNYNEHKQLNKVQPKIEKLVDIMGRANPVKVFGLAQNNRMFAKAILKSKCMLNWLLHPILKIDELSNLMTTYLQNNNDHTDLIDTFSQWEISHFNSAFNSTLSNEHVSLIRWGMLCRADIVSLFSPHQLELHINFLMTNLEEMTPEKIASLDKRVRKRILRKLTSLNSIQTREKALALTHDFSNQDFVTLRKSKYSLPILIGRFPKETIEFLKSRPAYLNYKESACTLLNQLHDGYWKAPEANDLHVFLNSFISPNMYDLIELGVYQADTTYSLNDPRLKLSSNPFVIDTIVNDLKKTFIAPLSRNFYKNGTPLAYIFVLNNEKILRQLNSSQLTKLLHAAVENDLSLHHFSIAGKIYGENENLLKELLKKQEKYQSPSFWPSKSTLIAMFLGATAGIALALSYLRKYIPHILLGVAATGASFGIGPTVGLVTLCIVGGAITGAVTIWLAKKAARLISTGAKKFWNYIRGKSPEAIEEKSDYYIFLNALIFTPTENLRKIFFANPNLQEYLYKTMKKYKDKNWKLKGIPKPTQELIVSIAHFRESQIQKCESWFYRKIAFPIANLIWSIEKRYQSELHTAYLALGIVYHASQMNLGNLPPIKSTMKGVNHGQIKILIDQPGDRKDQPIAMNAPRSAYDHRETVVDDRSALSLTESKSSNENPFNQMSAYSVPRRLSLMGDTSHRPTIARQSSDKGAYSEPCDWSDTQNRFIV